MARYELVERIGMGGMAEIYRGKAIAGGGFEKPVAIKKILPHLSQDKRFVELLITEAKTLSSLRHRNIVQIYDVGLGDDGQYFLVMEYVDGTDLGALYEYCEKRNRRLPLGVALHVCGEVCEALDHAHRARGPKGEPIGLVHRDVSPSNVLLSRSGEVKLTDFGIAKRTEEVTGHGGVRGKFAYISPEQAHNTHVDGRSDVYSVGIMLYELVTGARLFSDLPDFDALRAVREGRTRRPRDVDPSIDPELDRIVMTALAHRAEDRYPTAANFGAQLRSYRYTAVSAAAEPAIDVSRLVQEMGGREPIGAAPAARNPTFVRISTVAGFSGGFELSEETTGDGFTGEQTQDRALDDDESPRDRRDRHHGDHGRADHGHHDHDHHDHEPTHSVRLGENREAVRFDSEMHLDEGDTRVSTDPGPSAARRDRGGERDRLIVEASTASARPPTGEFDLSDAETSVMDYRRPRGLFERVRGRRDSGGPDVVGLPGVFHTVSPGDALPTRERPAASDSGLGSVISSAPRSKPASKAPPASTAASSSAARAAASIAPVPEGTGDRAPTLRRWLRSPWSSDPEQAAPAARPNPAMPGVLRPASRFLSRRRRTILIASGAALVAATLTFVFADTLIGGDDSAAADIPDAAPPPDAAVTMTMPPEPVPSRPKKKKKKPPAKKK
ncbi:MAG TPA: serine/threonine-protein kinase, partial [Kofleriaceae bacterium]|nr:serine/threonine-protein kinase [Kofleriaceae bacterium]